MTITQKTIITLIVAASAGTALYQFLQSGRFERELEAMSQQQSPLAQQVETLRQERENLKSELQRTQGQLVEARKKESELIRLRGQFTQMQTQADREKRGQQLPKTPQVTTTEAAPTPPVLQTHSLKTLVRIPNGHTMVAGGWQSSAGKRTITLITPVSQAGEQGEPQIVVRSVVVEATDAVWQQVGLGGIQTGADQQATPNSLTGEQMQTLLQSLQSMKDVDVLSAPTVSTINGRAAEISVGGGQQPGDTNAAPGIRLNLTPSLTADRTAVDLNVDMQISTLHTNQ
ncbi:MAG: hypothetical protein WCO56_21775 [Verrucomicrobiota bacterium]